MKNLGLLFGLMLFLNTALVRAEEGTNFSWAESLYNSGTLPNESDFTQNYLLLGSSVYINEPDSAVEKHGLVYVEFDSANKLLAYYFEYIKNELTSTWSLEKFNSIFQAQKQNFRPIAPNAEGTSLVSWNTKGSYALRRAVSFENDQYLVAQRVCELEAGCKFPYTSAGNVLHNYAFKEVVDYTYYKLNPTNP